MTSDLLPDFETTMIDIDGCRMHARVAGSGPPLLMLHGYPQTLVCWRHLAPTLSRTFTVVLVDLPGYGDTRTPDVAGYGAKRAMAGVLTEMMASLGFARFRLVGHDRGARAAYRLALDHPSVVERLAVISILPTFWMWRRLADVEYAQQAFRWSFLAQPAPLPETLIGGAPEAYLEATLRGWTKGKSLAVFGDALDAYRTAFVRPEVIAGSCADYRAGWDADRLHDNQDLQSGRKIVCPLLCLWGLDEFADMNEMRTAWEEVATNVTTVALDCGHFVPEEAPTQALDVLLRFLGPIQDEELHLSRNTRS